MGDLVMETTESLYRVRASGYAPHSCFCIPFGRLDSPDEWLQAQNFRDIQAKLTGESSTGVVKVMIQQLRMG